MKLYAYQPRGHGYLSYFIMAKDRETADVLVREESKGEIDDTVYGSNELYYAITEHEENEIVINDNA